MGAAATCSLLKELTSLSRSPAAFKASPQTTRERMKFLRGLALLSPGSGESSGSIVLPFAARAGGWMAGPWHGFYPKKLQALLCSSWRLQARAAVSEVLIVAALLLQYQYLCSSKICQDSMFP